MPLSRRTLLMVGGSTLFASNVRADRLVARFSYTPEWPDTGQTVTLDGSASNAPGAGVTIEKYQWQVQKDGYYEYPTGETTEVSFDTEGDHEVTLTVTNSNGGKASKKKTVIVGNEVPLADFTISDPEPDPGQEIVLDASPSKDPDGSIERYEWVIEDGSVFGDRQITWTWENPGEYYVKLTVTDDAGASEERIRTFNVRESTATETTETTPTETPTPTPTPTPTETTVSTTTSPTATTSTTQPSQQKATTRVSPTTSIQAGGNGGDTWSGGKWPQLLAGGAGGLFVIWAARRMMTNGNQEIDRGSVSATRLNGGSDRPEETATSAPQDTTLNSSQDHSSTEERGDVGGSFDGSVEDVLEAAESHMTEADDAADEGNHTKRVRHLRLAVSSFEEIQRRVEGGDGSVEELDEEPEERLEELRSELRAAREIQETVEELTDQIETAEQLVADADEAAETNESVVARTYYRQAKTTYEELLDTLERTDIERFGISVGDQTFETVEDIETRYEEVLNRFEEVN